MEQAEFHDNQNDNALSTWPDTWRKLSPKSRYWIEVVVLALLYYGVASLSLILFAFQNTNASPIWPPSGIAFWIILRRGFRFWPAVFLGAYVANISVFSLNLAGNAGSIAVASFFIGLGNTLEAVGGAFLFRRWCKRCNPFTKVYFLFKFLVLIPLVCLISSLMGSAILYLLKMINLSVYKTVWCTWWVGDVAGILTLSPLLLIGYYQRKRFLKPHAGFLESMVFIIAITALSAIVFGEHSYLLRQPYVLIPLVVWAAFRFGQIGVGVSIFLILGVAIWHTVNGLGPFVGSTLNESLLLCQVFVGFVTLTGLILTATLNEKKQFEEDLKRSAEELRRSNEDLDRFATIASHDLKEPLRIVSNYAGLLARNYKDKLDDKANQYIGYMLEGTHKMNDLIQDLLFYSRVGRDRVKISLVDTDAVCREVIKTMAIAIQESGAKISCHDLPSVMADATQVTQLFQNLISNAIKFRSKAAPVIQISAKWVDSEYLFVVQDNGIGIHPDHFTRIFEIFNRLHAQDEYAGSGIGLAICKKVIEAHGGRIWVESQLDKGTTFYFTFPKRRQTDFESESS